VSIREWMEANGIRVFAVTRAEFIESWQYHAEHQDGRTRSEMVSDDDHATDSYVLDRMARAFLNDEVHIDD
jgi:hypothetical protein